jgi:4-diphosphocytidyl-2-C-methyl-D-erythritol kinase
MARLGVIREDAPAKLNLYLHLLGKRADGYHLLESGVVFTSLVDTFEVQAADELRLVVEGAFAEQAGGGEGNLVLKAARLLQQETGVASGAVITLTKSIPVGAGLGGGSADAAATLRALMRLWGVSLTPEALHRIAIQLGADVAMCIESKPVIARGIGEELSPWPFPLPPMHALLVHPRVPLLSVDVYRAVDIAQCSTSPMSPLTNGEELVAYTRNDLEAPAQHVSPVVGEVLGALRALTPPPSLVRMTGSGACCFALYADANTANAALSALRAAHPQWWMALTKITAQ